MPGEGEPLWRLEPRNWWNWCFRDARIGRARRRKTALHLLPLRWEDQTRGGKEGGLRRDDRQRRRYARRVQPQRKKRRVFVFLGRAGQGRAAGQVPELVIRLVVAHRYTEKQRKRKKMEIVTVVVVIVLVL